MLEFKTIEELKPNTKLLELIKNFNYKTKKGKVKVISPFTLKSIKKSIIWKKLKLF